METLRVICENPLFGIFITLIAYEIAVILYQKTKFVLFNPLLVSIVLVIAFLLVTGIPYETYNIGGKIISMFISPITVVLAIPLYMQIQVLKDHAFIIVTAIFLGCVTAIASICAFQYFFPMDSQIFASILPKSITTAIAVELTQEFGGIEAITVIAVLIAGLFGAIFSPILAKIFHIRDEISLGLAIGTSSHALGTSKALELGERTGAMSGLSIGVAGIITVLVAPLIVKLFGVLS